MSWTPTAAVTLVGTTVRGDGGEHQVVPLIGIDRVDLSSVPRETFHPGATGEVDWSALAQQWGVVYSFPAQGSRIWWDRQESVSGDHLISVLKTLRSVMPETGRILVVSGEVRIRAEDDYDSVGALAAAVIRLRIDQWVGVGLAVKALSTQVGLEGSWDGESLWWELPADAYDYMRAWPGPDDVVLLSGDASSEIQAIVELIGAHRQ